MAENAVRVNWSLILSITYANRFDNTVAVRRSQAYRAKNSSSDRSRSRTSSPDAATCTVTSLPGPALTDAS